MITVKTTKPYTLVKTLQSLIDEGEIATWSYDEDGDFTHDVTQWRNRAWFHPVRYKGDRVEFRLLGSSVRKLDRVEYAVYHGRFIEMLTSHVSSLCNIIMSTPNPTNKDNI